VEGVSSVAQSNVRWNQLSSGLLSLRCYPALLSSLQPVTESDPSRPREVRLCPYCQGTLVPMARLTAVQVQARNLIPALDTS
jgi:hypothetical protein